MSLKARIVKIRLPAMALIVGTLSIGGTIAYYMLLSHKYASENAQLAVQLREVEDSVEKLESSLLASNDYQSQIEDVARATMAFESRQDKVRANVQAFMQNYSRKARLIGSPPEVVARLDRVRESVVTNEQMLRALSTLLSRSRVFLESMPSITPASGEFSSGFGPRRSPFTHEVVMHRGMDIGADIGSGVRATADGEVIYAGGSESFGNLVIIEHEFGIITKYAHNSRLLVHKGQKIHRGQKVALVGNTGHSTGPHLHYEVWVNNQPVNPSDYLLDKSTGDYFAHSDGRTAIGGEEFSVPAEVVVNSEAEDELLGASVPAPPAKKVKFSSKRRAMLTLAAKPLPRESTPKEAVPVSLSPELEAQPIPTLDSVSWRPFAGLLLMLAGGLALVGLLLMWRRMEVERV